MKLKVISYPHKSIIVYEDTGLAVAHVHDPAMAHEIIVALEVAEHVPVLLSTLVHLMIETDFDDEVIDAMYAIDTVVKELAAKIKEETT